MRKEIEFTVEKNTLLMEFLIESLPQFNRKKIKALLLNKAIMVNNKEAHKYNHPLMIGDKVLIVLNGNDSNLERYKIEIIYNDKNIIAINKPSGLLTVETDNDDNITAYRLVSEYLKKYNKNNRIFIIHRLDKDTSGVLVFAKDKETKNPFQDAWDVIALERKYYAVVSGKLKQQEGQIISYLKEDKNMMVYSTKEKDGKKAITKYKVLKENDLYSLLNIELKTGRKNQIRVHMTDIGHNVVGDRKYGFIKSPLKRLGLHAYRLVIKNPINNKILTFEVPIPKEFTNLFKK